MARPSIPEPIKRAVRQRCGYGCVFCGMPVYEYDHIIEWAETGHHTADQLTLLCPRHHAEKTRKLLSRAQVEEANAAPFNVTNGVTSPYGLHFEERGPMQMLIGSDEFTSTAGDMAPIVVDNAPLIALTRTDEGLGLWLTMRDEFNHPILAIQNNVIEMSPAAQWDITWVGQVLTLRSAPRKIFARFRFEPPSRFVVERALLLVNGIRIEINDGELCLNSGESRARFSGNRWRDVAVGFTVGWCPDFPTMVSWLRFDVNRYQPSPAATVPDFLVTNGDSDPEVGT